MQGAAAGGVFAPGSPGGQKVQPQTKAGFENDKALALLPAARQLVAGQKYLPALLWAAVTRMVDIVKLHTGRRCGVGQIESGGF